VRLLDVELAHPLADVAPLAPALGGDYAELQILVRLHRRPLGIATLKLPPDGLDAGQLADAIWFEMADAIRNHCAQDDLAGPEKLTAEGLLPPGNAPCSWRAPR